MADNAPLAEEERRTLFIAGLPEIVSEEEVRHLFCFCPSFEQASVQHKGNKPLGFARFKDHASALEASTILQGYAFTDTCTLRVELANKNLVVKDHSGPSTYGLGKRPRTEQQPPYAPQYAPQMQQAWDPAAMQQAGYDPSQMYGYQPQAYPAYMPPGAQMYGGTPQAYGGAPVYQSGYGGAPKGGGGAPTKACNTLFVANIGESSEPELQARFSQYSGYVRLQKGRKADCFVEFSDEDAATQAKGMIHGNMGMRAEFAKNPLGRRSH